MKSIRSVGAATLIVALAGCETTTSGSQTASTVKATPVAKLLPKQVYLAPTPTVQTAPVAQASVDLGPLDSIASVPQPVLQAVPEPTYVLASPGYAETQPLRARSMAPIYDDPVDGSPERTASNMSSKAAYRPTNVSSGGAPSVRNAYTPAFGMQLADAAKGRLNPNIRYDARYVKIGFPWGDVPESTGVCTDVVIRSYRALGVDLQSLVHDDMRSAFSAYPSRRIYGLKKADPNIDHRRVVNLEAFFERVGAGVPATMNPEDYHPGDVVTWRLSGNEPHTGVISANRDPRTGNPLVIHNLGAGVREEDILFLSPPIGHYRFAPDRQTRMAALALGGRS